MPVPKVEVGELYEYKELVLHQLGPEVNNDECLLENGYVLDLTRFKDGLYRNLPVRLLYRRCYV